MTASLAKPPAARRFFSLPLPGGRGKEGGTPTTARFAFFVFIATFVLIISHGCHGDDIDTEPAVAPPLHAERE